MPRLAQKWIKMYLRVFSKVLKNDILGYFAFLQFYGCGNASKGGFLGKNHYILQKISILGISAAVKLEKKKKLSRRS